MSVFYIIFFLLLLFFLIYIRQKRIIRKIRSMSSCAKTRQLNAWMQPFGFFLLPEQNLISSTQDAWQREYGYHALYDRSAPCFNMIFDREPVYFDYDGRTWLVEFWKGQYGINTGCEIGIYHADSILSENQYSQTLFHAVSDDEMLPLSMKLFAGEELLLSTGRTHWWLTGFRTGCFSHPKDLTMHLSVTFPDVQMQQRFVSALRRLGYCTDDLDIDGLTVSLLFTRSHTEAPRTFCALYLRWVQWKNRIFCRLYLFVTRPFCRTGDRLLYLCCSLPAALRRMLRFRRCRVQTPPRKRRDH